MRGNAAEVGSFSGDPGRMSVAESRELERCEAVIEQGLETFVEVGKALLRICDGVGTGPLYRATYDNMDTYLRERWHLSRPHAYQLMNAAKTAIRINEGLSSIEDKDSFMRPQSEYQLRPLSSLPIEQRPEAWALAVETADGGQPTAAQVKAAVNELFTHREPADDAIDEALETYVRDDGSEIEPGPSQERKEPFSDTWTDEVLKFSIFFNSVRRRGGIGELTKNWSKSGVEHFISAAQRYVSEMQSFIDELKGGIR